MILELVKCYSGLNWGVLASECCKNLVVLNEAPAVGIAKVTSCDLRDGCYSQLVEGMSAEAELWHDAE